MKKLFLITLGALLVVGFGNFGICANPDNNVDWKKMPKIEWKCQAAYPAGQTVIHRGTIMRGGMTTLRATFKTVSERTGGRFNITVYEPGVLSGPQGFYGAIKSGTLEMLYAFPWYLSNQIPLCNFDAGIFFLTKSPRPYIPIIFQTGEWLEVVRAAYAEHNIRYLIPLAWGGHYFQTNFPIHSIDDFKGKIFRGYGPLGEMIKMFGGKNAFVTVPEAYTALQRKTIDGWSYAASAAARTGYMEVIDYISVPSYMNPNMSFLIANMDAWNKLPKIYQDILNCELMHVSKDCFTFISDTWDDWGLNVGAPKYNVKRVELPEEEYNKMRDIQLPVWEKLAAKDKYSARIFELVKKAAAEYYEK